MDSEVIASGRARVRYEQRAVASIEDAIDGSFYRAVDLIRSVTGKVFVAGAGTSGWIAGRMAHLLSTTGTAAVFLHPSDALHGSLGAISHGDAVIVVSKGGKSQEINEFAAGAQARGARLLVITYRLDSPLAASADVAVKMPDTPDADPGGIVAMGSTLAVAAWGDALAHVLMELSGYTWKEVVDAHPSGAVGQITDLPPQASGMRDLDSPAHAE